MNLEVGYPHGIDQNNWLNGVLDRLLQGGICMALVYEWATTYVKGGDPTSLLGDLLNTDGPNWQRKLSFQRAYDGAWFDNGRRQQYPQFHPMLEAATTRFIVQNGRREGVTITRIIDTHNPVLCGDHLRAIAPNDVFILVLDGDGNPGEAHGIWAHVVGVAYKSQPGQLRPRYFDPNKGFFNLDNANNVGTEVLDTINAVYHVQYSLNVLGYILYQVSL